MSDVGWGMGPLPTSHIPPSSPRYFTTTLHRFDDIPDRHPASLPA